MRTHSDPTRRSSDRVREGKVAAERALWGRGRAAGRRLLPPGRCGRRQGEDQRDKPGGRKGFSYDPDHSQHERGKPPQRPMNAKTQKLPPEGETSDRATADAGRSEEHTSELQSLMRISYAVFCLKKKKYNTSEHNNKHSTDAYTLNHD